MLVAATLAAALVSLLIGGSWLGNWLSGETVDQLNTVLHWALLLVLVGVIVEEWGLIKHFASFIRYSWDGRFREALSKARSHKREIIEGAGFSILIIGLAGELAISPFVEAKQRVELQTQKQQTADALQRAGELGVDVTNLHTFVNQKENEIGKQLGNFQSFADEERKNLTGAIAALNARQKEVAATIKAAQDDEAELRASANTISDLRQNLHDLTTDRILNEREYSSLVKAAKGKRGIEFDMATHSSAEAWAFAKQIASALQAGGWFWQPRPAFGGLKAKGVTDMGSDPRSGLFLEMCETDRVWLDPYAALVRNELLRDGFASTGTSFEEADMTFKGAQCGRLHIVVGSRY